VSGGPTALVAVLVPRRSGWPRATAAPSPSRTPARSRANPTVVENEKEGSADWEITAPAEGGEIEGYASATQPSSGAGAHRPVRQHASTRITGSTSSAWAGTAARAARPRGRGPSPAPASGKPVPPPDPTTGLVECRWREPYHLPDRGPRPVPGRAGVYLARLTASPSGRQAYIVFVVRDDDRRSALLFQSSVTTYAAYNNWGGRSLYAFNSGLRPAPQGLVRSALRDEPVRRPARRGGRFPAALGVQHAPLARA